MDFVASRRNETSRESRQIILSTATQLFAERGFRQTTFADIAEHSGISRGSIPWHFGNKDGLLEAVIDDMLSSLDLELGTPATIEAGFASVLEFVRHPNTRLLITLVAEAVEPESPIQAFYANFHASMRKWATTWTASNPLPKGVSREIFATVLVASVIGLHQQWRVAPDSVDLDRCFAGLAAFIERKR